MPWCPLDSDFKPLADVRPFYTLVKPKHPERESVGAKHKHKIPMTELLLHAPESERVADWLYDWFVALKLPFKKCLVPLAHNWAFESSFLKAWLGVEQTDLILPQPRPRRDALRDLAQRQGGLRGRAGPVPTSRPGRDVHEAGHRQHQSPRRPGRLHRRGGSLPRLAADVLRRLQWDRSGLATSGTTSSSRSTTASNNAQEGDPLPEVAAGHIWLLGDIIAVRNKLEWMCRNGPEILGRTLVKWKQEIIDELNDAIDNCDCGCTQALVDDMRSLHGQASYVSALVGKHQLGEE